MAAVVEELLVFGLAAMSEKKESRANTWYFVDYIRISRGGRERERKKGAGANNGID